jgi:hypothetical protein
MSGTPLDDNRRGFPLAALFVLVTACAALIAVIAPVVQHLWKGDVSLETILTALICGGIGGLILGLVVGTVQHGWKLGTPIGAIIGLSLGVVAGLLALAPANLLPRMAVALVVGSGLMIGVAVFTRQRR